MERKILRDMKTITFGIENYVDEFSGTVCDTFKVILEGEVIYTKAYGYSDRNIFDYIQEFLSEAKLRSEDNDDGIYTIEISEGDSTYSVTDPHPREYVTDDTL